MIDLTEQVKQANLLIYREMKRLYNGYNLTIMKEFKDNSIDTIITDPPYGLSFMGKKWDYDVPGVETWQECLRVLKPGGTALIFAGSRTQHRMAVNVENAGFILKDCIMWLYGSGFPKAIDISKQLDKGQDIERKTYLVPIAYSDSDCWGKPNSNSKGNDIGFETQRTGKRKDMDGKGNQIKSLPVTPEAKLWDGWKSHGLKPAYEPILVAMKPNEGTYAENALKHGVTGLNIDGGRIGMEVWVRRAAKNSTPYGDKRTWNTSKTPNIDRTAQGRYPANIILDEEAGKMLDEQTGTLKSGGSKADKVKNTFQSNSGGASRFFYCAKASKSERGKGNNHPTVKPLKLMEYLCNLTKTPTDGVVLDPYMGSGTTGVACIRTGRDFIGIEEDNENFNIAEKRINGEFKNENRSTSTTTCKIHCK